MVTTRQDKPKYASLHHLRIERQLPLSRNRVYIFQQGLMRSDQNDFGDFKASSKVTAIVVEAVECAGSGAAP